MLVERFLATALGAASGAVLYGAWEILARYLPPRSSFFFAIPLSWYIFGGAIFGLLGGFQAARGLWDYTLNRLESESTDSVWLSVVFVIIGVVTLLVFWTARSA